MVEPTASTLRPGPMMDDLSSLPLDDLLARVGRTITRRRDSISIGDRLRAADDLQHLLDELSRRGCRPYFVRGPASTTSTLS